MTPDPAGSRAGDPFDVEVLRSLSSAYAAAVDARDGDALAALFVESGELLVPDVPVDLAPVVSRVGHEALRLVPEGLRRYSRTFHQVSDHRFTLVGGRATGEVQCVAHHLTAAPTGVSGNSTATDTVWYIRYHDDYVNTDAGWRFERRALHLQWVEEHPVALLAAEVHTGRQTDAGRRTDAGRGTDADRGAGSGQASGTS